MTEAADAQKRVEELQRQLENVAEENFELQAALATVDAEHKLTILTVEQEQQQEVRNLREQLRRAQQEANHARGQASRYETKLAEQHQQQAQQSFANRLALPPPVNFLAHPVPVAKPVVTPTNLDEEEKCHKNKSGHPLPRPSDESTKPVALTVSSSPVVAFSGVTLAQHLLRNKPLSHKVETSPVLMHLSRIATDSCTVSSTHVVWILVQEVVTTARADTSPERTALYSQLAWLYTAFKVCPDACRSILLAAAAAVPNETRRKRRRPKVRIGTSTAQLDSMDHSSLYNKLHNPLWDSTTGQKSSIYDPQQQEQPMTTTPLEQRAGQEFSHILCHQCILQTQHIQTSILGMKILNSLLAYATVSEQLWVSWWNSLAQPEMSLFQLWEQAVLVLLKRYEQQQPPVPQQSSERPIHIVVPVHYTRLLDQECVVNDNHGQIDDSNVWRNVDSTDICTWMSTCLETLIRFWKIASDSITRQRQWFGPSQRARRLLVGVLDVLDCIILPDKNLYTCPLVFSCLSWMNDALLLTYQGCLLLRASMPTTLSTAETWHRACCAIGVAVKMFHEVVVLQHLKDHLPATSAENRVLNPIRDQLIRFFHGILRMVQNDHQVWEQRRRSDNLSKTVSFSSLVLSEFPELYTSAASLLLTVTESSACTVSEDIEAMLKLQIQEIRVEQQETQELKLRQSSKRSNSNNSAE